MPRFEASLGYAYARAGRQVEAETILERFSRGPTAPHVSPVERALIALSLGETEAALGGLEAAYAARLPGTLIAGDPFFSELAGERRYRELKARLQLPPASLKGPLSTSAVVLDGPRAGRTRYPGIQDIFVCDESSSGALVERCSTAQSIFDTRSARPNRCCCQRSDRKDLWDSNGT